MVIYDDSDLIGIWEIKTVELILFENNINLTNKINDCERKEHLSIENLNKVVWVSYFPWLNEQTSICSERAESIRFRLIENQILVEEFNNETTISGEIVNSSKIIVYRYHNTDEETSLKFTFQKINS